MNATQKKRAEKIKDLRRQAGELDEVMGDALRLGNLREADEHAAELRRLKNRLHRLVELNEGQE